MACQFFLDLVARFAVTIAMNTGTASKNVNSTPMPDPIREEEVNIQLTWTADARTELAIRRQASLIGFKNPADYITQMIARSLASNDEQIVITRDGRLVHKSHSYDSDGVPQHV
jgi:hypothetical protein